MDGQDTIMSLSNVSWEAEFRKLFEVGSDRYQQGKREVSSFFQPEELELLQRIGYRAQEMFDFLEDHVNYGAPDYATAYKVAVLRGAVFSGSPGGELDRPGGGGFSTASQDRYHGWSRLVSTISG